MGANESTKARLERGFHILQRILLRRAMEGSATIGWGVERAIIDRELRELEEQCRQEFAVPPMAGWIIRDDVTRPGSVSGKLLRRRGHPAEEGV